MTEERLQITVSRMDGSFYASFRGSDVVALQEAVCKMIAVANNVELDPSGKPVLGADEEEGDDDLPF